MTVKIRVMGTASELDSMRAILTDDSRIAIRSISEAYRNRGASTESRVYIEADIHVICPKETVKRETCPTEDLYDRLSKCKRIVGECYKCGHTEPLCMMRYGHGGYVGYCIECAKGYLDEQAVGMMIREEDPVLWDRWLKRYHEHEAQPHIVYMSGAHSFTI